MSDHYINIKFDLLDNDEFLKMFKGKFMFYCKSRRYIARYNNNEYGNGHGSNNWVHTNYWKNGLLASCRSLEFYAKKLGVSKNTIPKWINELKDLGVIAVDKIGVGRKAKYVLIFGEHNMGVGKLYKEKFYVNDPKRYHKMDEYVTRRMKEIDHYKRP